MGVAEGLVRFDSKTWSFRSAAIVPQARLSRVLFASSSLSTPTGTKGSAPRRFWSRRQQQQRERDEDWVQMMQVFLWTSWFARAQNSIVPRSRSHSGRSCAGKKQPNLVHDQDQEK